MMTAALGLTAVTGFGQGTKADYDRAAEIRKRYSGKVYNESLRPNWFGGNQFWYETNVRGERQYVLVNGGKGKRRAFSDKEKFDEALKRRKLANGGVLGIRLCPRPSNTEGQWVDLETEEWYVDEVKLLFGSTLVN